jgi:carbohydrate kinase (thermoresistant glucokinase family)
MNKIIFIMGVSGSGKTVLGHLLAKELSVPFIDADDHHPASNIEKMSLGAPLNDQDRMPWLEQLNQIAIKHLGTGGVIACSALKKDYRRRLTDGISSTDVQWVYLQGTYEQISLRMKNRQGHFMKPVMLRSQFEALEEPDDALTINISDTPEDIIKSIKSFLN